MHTEAGVRLGTNGPACVCGLCHSVQASSQCAGSVGLCIMCAMCPLRSSVPDVPDVPALECALIEWMEERHEAGVGPYIGNCAFGAIRVLSRRIHGELEDARGLLADWNGLGHATHWPPLPYPLLFLLAEDQLRRGDVGCALAFIYGCLLFFFGMGSHGRSRAVARCARLRPDHSKPNRLVQRGPQGFGTPSRAWGWVESRVKFDPGPKNE
mgnify:CR=1 FL=1